MLQCHLTVNHAHRTAKTVFFLMQSVGLQYVGIELIVILNETTHLRLQQRDESLMNTKLL